MKISVYITSYNQKEFLVEAVESVLSQTIMPFEILIIDDASTDGSEDLINNYCLQYSNLIKAFFNPVNKGITYCRNKALSLVKGNYITWLDGDDIYLPKKLEIQANLIEDSGSNMVYTNYYYSYKEITDIYQIWFSNIDELPKTKNIFKEVISRKFPKSNLFRYELVESNLLKSVGGYDDKLDLYEDFDFRIRLCKTAIITFSIEPLSVYRIHGKGLSNADKEVHLKSLNHIYSKYENEISKYSEKEAIKIKKSIEYYLSKLNPKIQNTISIKTRIKQKLISIINKI